MKVETVERDIQRSDNFEERAMGLAVGSESFVFNVLRKDLYSDPIGSLIREYTINAQDEHKKYGVVRPIEITVPTQFSPELHIRDYANGLTEEQVFTYFGQYGASDKRDSNDVVGFYGLGCKSAFAYTDSYVVKSFKDGKAYTFNIYIDETEIGRVAKITEEDTDEPNGVLIIVPVKTKDIWDFQNKVLKTVAYFKTKPVIEGLGHKPEFATKVSKIEGDGWRFYGSGSSVCVMGEIAYPINYNAIDNLESWERGLLGSDLEMDLNIGEVQVTASREALQMSPKTIGAIRSKLGAIKDTMVSEATKAFADAKTLFEAKSLYYKVIMKGGMFGQIVRNSGESLVWNGVNIDNNIISFEQGKHWITQYTSTWSSRIKEGSHTVLRCGEDVDIYFDDVEKAKYFSRRAKTLLSGGVGVDRRKIVNFLHTTDVADLETIIGMSVADLPKLSEVVPAVVTRNGRESTADKSKHNKKVFKLNTKKLMSYGTASEVWDTVELGKGGVFIPIDRFKPYGMSKFYSLLDIREILDTLKKVGVNVDLPIYGVKKADSVEGMIRFDEWVVRKVNALSDYKKKYAMIRELETRDLLEVDQIDPSKVSGEIAQYIVRFKEATELYKNYDLKRLLYKVFSYVNVPNPHELEQMSEKVSERYPLLPLINEYHRGKDEVIDYINGADEKNILTNVAGV